MEKNGNITKWQGLSTRILKEIEREEEVIYILCYHAVFDLNSLEI